MSAISKLSTLASTHPKKTAAVAVAALVLIGGTGAGVAYMAHHVTTPQEHLAASQENQVEETLVLLKATGQGMDKALTRAQIAIFDSNHKCVVSSAEYEPEVFYDLGQLGKGTYFIVLKSLPVLEDGTLYIPKNMPPTFTINATDKPVSVLLEFIPITPENMSKEQLLQAASELKLAGKPDFADKLKAQAEHAESRPETDMARMMQEVTKGADTSQGTKVQSASNQEQVQAAGHVVATAPKLDQKAVQPQPQAPKSENKQEAKPAAQASAQPAPSNPNETKLEVPDNRPRVEKKRWVVDKPAYDEQVEDGGAYVFSDGYSCDTDEELAAYAKSFIAKGELPPSYSVQPKYKTIHHEEQGHWETYYE